MPPETIYEGPAHEATFYVPSAGIVRLGFSDPLASGYVCSRGGSFEREPGTRMSVSPGQHALSLYDPKLMARASITFEPH
jgi:hypothetical protein